MSRKPGIGHTWFQTWHTDIYKATTSNVRVRGHAAQPPRYYDKKYKEKNERAYTFIKRDRTYAASQHGADNTPERLKAKEAVAIARASLLKRNIH